MWIDWFQDEAPGLTADYQWIGYAALALIAWLIWRTWKGGRDQRRLMAWLSRMSEAMETRKPPSAGVCVLAMLWILSVFAGCASMPAPSGASGAYSDASYDTESRLQYLEHEVSRQKWREHTLQTQRMISPGYQPSPWEH